MPTQIGLRLPDELLTQLDKARGNVPRERWLRLVIEAVLADEPTNLDEKLPKRSNTLDLGNRADAFRRVTQRRS